MRNGKGGFWQTELGPPARRARLPGDLDVDVAIVGGGYTGLWTAYYLRCADPRLRVAVLEAEHAGFGASGRNGGWLSGTATGSRERYARASAAATPWCGSSVRRSTPSARSSGSCAEEGIEADLVRGGTLHVAQNPAAARAAAAEVEREREWGLGEDDLRLLEPDELRARIRIADALGASFTPHCARIHPARLVRGLADTVERRGATIYEGTRALRIGSARSRRRRGACAPTGSCARPRGTPRGCRASSARCCRSGSSMIVTEPLPADVWAEIGWDACETLLDGAHVYSYSQRTADGRIAIGGRGVPYRFGSGVDRNAECPPQTADQLRRTLSALFPAAARVPIDFRWSGVLGLARDWCASVGADPEIGSRLGGRLRRERRQHGEPDRAHARRPHARPRERARHASVGRAHVPGLRARAAALHRRPHALPGLSRGRSP